MFSLSKTCSLLSFNVSLTGTMLNLILKSWPSCVEPCVCLMVVQFPWCTSLCIPDCTGLHTHSSPTDTKPSCHKDFLTCHSHCEILVFIEKDHSLLVSQWTWTLVFWVKAMSMTYHSALTFTPPRAFLLIIPHHLVLSVFYCCRWICSGVSWKAGASQTEAGKVPNPTI